jgi:hypothetical protein
VCLELVGVGAEEAKRRSLATFVHIQVCCSVRYGVAEGGSGVDKHECIECSCADKGRREGHREVWSTDWCNFVWWNRLVTNLATRTQETSTCGDCIKFVRQFRYALTVRSRMAEGMCWWM